MTRPQQETPTPQRTARFIGVERGEVVQHGLKPQVSARAVRKSDLNGGAEFEYG